MTADTTTDSEWGYGEGYGYLDEPEPVTPGPATLPATSRATPPVTPGATLPAAWPVTPDAGDPVTPPLLIGDWTEVTTEGEPGQGTPAGRLTRLTRIVGGSPLLGASRLAAELADPRPGTLSQHWAYVRSHENMPEGTLAGIGFTAGHLAVTGPLKLTGKAMTFTGNALTWTGKRTDRASDNFTAAIIFLILATAIIVLIAMAAGPVITSL